MKKVYKICYDRDLSSCENDSESFKTIAMIEGDGSNCRNYFLTLEEAKKFYDSLQIADFAQKCGRNIYRFDSKHIDEYTVDDEDFSENDLSESDEYCLYQDVLFIDVSKPYQGGIYE